MTFSDILGIAAIFISLAIGAFKILVKFQKVVTASSQATKDIEMLERERETTTRQLTKYSVKISHLEQTAEKHDNRLHRLENYP